MLEKEPFPGRVDSTVLCGDLVYDLTVYDFLILHLSISFQVRYVQYIKICQPYMMYKDNATMKFYTGEPFLFFYQNFSVQQ